MTEAAAAATSQRILCRVDGFISCQNVAKVIIFSNTPHRQPLHTTAAYHFFNSRIRPKNHNYQPQAKNVAPQRAISEKNLRYLHIEIFNTTKTNNLTIQYEEKCIADSPRGLSTQTARHPHRRSQS
ncbi:MAG: hypothetical protein K2H99_00075, partial [Paramuribaculum sp.]|nr:hypothetical protein [Paramuribaculum sp.]